jgi:hypothetical protein
MFAALGVFHLEQAELAVEPPHSAELPVDAEVGVPKRPDEVEGARARVCHQRCGHGDGALRTALAHAALQRKARQFAPGAALSHAPLLWIRLYAQM